MGRVVHFEIHAAQPERAVAFYIAVFGWQIEKWGGHSHTPYWLVTTGDNKDIGINGAILQRRGDNPPTQNTLPMTGYVCTIEVVSVDETSQKVVNAGGQIVVEKMAVPGIGWRAYAKDSEGNIFGLLQSDAKAK